MAHPGSVFLVNLAGLELPPATLKAIERDINAAVDKHIAEVAVNGLETFGCVISGEIMSARGELRIGLQQPDARRPEWRGCSCSSRARRSRTPPSRDGMPSGAP